MSLASYLGTKRRIVLAPSLSSLALLVVRLCCSCCIERKVARWSIWSILLGHTFPTCFARPRAKEN
jgi:hypothetical protein